jgi:Protein of unknown function (DUF3106)
MNPLRQQCVCLAAGLAVSWFSLGPATAQTTATPAAAPGKSPVSFFRELLAMAPVERQQALSNRPLENQQRILAKIGEYEALSADERALRLQVTELRWYLVPLLSLPPGKRADALSQVPASLRPLIESRLEQWTILPPPIRDQILEDDQKLQLYLQLTGSIPAPQPEVLRLYPPGMREQLEAEVQKLNPFFEMTSEEKAKVLATLPLSESERREMQATLRAFDKLPADQRAECVRAFGKFAGMSAAERQQFLRNAERWQAMSPAERERWRDLVRDVPLWPPLPPGIGQTAPVQKS